MLVIRSEQLARLNDAHLDSWLASHIERHFEEEAALLTPAELSSIVAHGRKRAADYGIDAPSDVTVYVDLMMTFGRDFDKDSEHPWAAEILNDQTIRDSADRVAWLYERALGQLPDD